MCNESLWKILDHNSNGINYFILVLLYENILRIAKESKSVILNKRMFLKTYSYLKISFKCFKTLAEFLPDNVEATDNEKIHLVQIIRSYLYRVSLVETAIDLISARSI